MSYDRWQERVRQEVGEEGFARLSTRLLEGIEVEPLYTTDHPSDTPVVRPDTAGMPGAWRICADLESGTEGSMRACLRESITGGADAARLMLGGEGLENPSAADLASLFEALPEAGFDLVLDAGADALPAAALILAAMDRKKQVSGRLRLFFQADPLAALARLGRLPRPVADLEAEQAALTRYTIENLPGSRAVGVDGLPYQEAGAHAVQELGFAVATGVHYLRSLERSGLDVASAAGQISFVCGVGGDVFLEIAKLRALRALWSRVLAACDAPGTPPPRIHAVVSRRALSGIDPWNNILRVTTGAFAAALGGADAISTPELDESPGASGADSRRLARSVQLILAAESHLSRVVDAAGGSYYIERLTDRLARDGWEQLREVERHGGMVASLVAGWPQTEIGRVAEERRRRSANREQPITGVSVSADPSQRISLPPRLESAAAPAVSLGEGGPVALPELIDLAVAGATLTELVGRLAVEKSTPLTAEPLRLRRDAEPWERLRRAADELPEGPSIVLLGLGDPADHRPRFGFAADFFHAGGFASREVVADDELSGIERGTLAVCVCGSDEAYAGSIVDVAAGLRQRGVERILAAGRPQSVSEGTDIDVWIHQGCNAVSVLGDLLHLHGARVEGMEV